MSQFLEQVSPVHFPSKASKAFLIDALRRKVMVDAVSTHFLHNILTYQHIVVVVESLSQDWVFVTPWTIACHAPLSVKFPRQEYWSGLPLPSLGDLPEPGIKIASPTLTGRFFTTDWATREAQDIPYNLLKVLLPSDRAVTRAQSVSHRGWTFHYHHHHPTLLCISDHLCTR